MAKKKNHVVHAPKSCRSLRAVEEFSCIGGDCENTCCQTWKVTLTKGDYVAWRNLAKKSPAELKLFEQHVPRGDKGYATLAFDKKTGVCPFHDESGLCRVHAELGADALPATCRTFPKVYNVDKSTMQANASLACPEYVRNVIANDAATDVLGVGMPKANTQVMNLSSIGHSWHWQRSLPEIGELGLSIIKNDSPRATLAEKMFVLTMMVGQFDELGNHANSPLTLELLSRRVAPFLEAKTRTEIVSQFRQISVPESNFSLQFIYSLFAYRMTIEWKEMSTLWDGIHASYKDLVPAEMHIVPGQSYSVDVDSIAPAFYERRKQLHARAGVELQQWYGRAFCNQFFSSGAASEETPLGYLGRHVLTVMMFDFAVCSHEDVNPLLAGIGPLSETEKEQLKKHVVNIVHRVGRTVLHVGHITTSIAALMQEQQLDSMALITTMLKDFAGDSKVREIKLNPIAAMMR